MRPLSQAMIEANLRKKANRRDFRMQRWRARGPPYGPCLAMIGADVEDLSDVFLIATIRYRPGADFRRRTSEALCALKPNDAMRFKEGA